MIPRQRRPQSSTSTPSIAPNHDGASGNGPSLDVESTKSAHAPDTTDQKASATTKASRKKVKRMLTGPGLDKLRKRLSADVAREELGNKDDLGTRHNVNTVSDEPAQDDQMSREVDGLPEVTAVTSKAPETGPTARRRRNRASKKVKARKEQKNPSPVLCDVDTAQESLQGSAIRDDTAQLPTLAGTDGVIARGKRAVLQLVMSKNRKTKKIAAVGTLKVKKAEKSPTTTKSSKNAKPLTVPGWASEKKYPAERKAVFDLLTMAAKMNSTDAPNMVLASNLRQLVTRLDEASSAMDRRLVQEGVIADSVSAFKTMKDAMQGKPLEQKSTAPGKAARDVTKALLGGRTRDLSKELSGEIETIDSRTLTLTPVEKSQPAVPTVSYGLDRVLFNPGVYHLRDPRSRVFNFDPYLQSIMPVAEFDFNALKEYITSSRDSSLLETAAAEKKKYTGSTSSMTSALAHFHFLLSQWRPIDTSSLSQGFSVTSHKFTLLQRGPTAIFLRYKEGTYAIDADKQYDSANILSMLGKSMEKLLTVSKDEYERYRKPHSDQISQEERDAPESFHYTTMGDFLMRSQLDAYDPRLPGTGMFDLKTRAVVSIRMDARDYEKGLGYEIRDRHGQWESYEREYYDMIRAAFLKYSLQVRMGRMDGIFVAFHNTERIFGFQYISLSEMDQALHGTSNTTTGDSEFKLSLGLLNNILDRATSKYPEKSLRIHFETRDAKVPFTYVFAEPVEEEEIDRIQTTNKQSILEFEQRVLGLHSEPTEEELKDTRRVAEWEALNAQVEEEVSDDELGIEHKGEESGSDLDAKRNVVAERSTGQPQDVVPQDSIDESTEGVLAKDGEDYDEVVSSAIQTSSGQEGAVAQRDQVILGSDSDLGADDEAQLDHQTPDEGVRVVSDESLGDNAVLVTSEPPSDAGDSTVERQTVTGTSTPAQDDSPKEATAGSDAQDLLAMIVTIRNKVNGDYVLRPEALETEDQWEVEYSVTEVAQPKAGTLHRECLARREALFNRRDDTANYYTAQLREYALKGKDFRTKEDALDAQHGLQAFDESQSSRPADE